MQTAFTEYRFYNYFVILFINKRRSVTHLFGGKDFEEDLIIESFRWGIVTCF